MTRTQCFNAVTRLHRARHRGIGVSVAVATRDCFNAVTRLHRAPHQYPNSNGMLALTCFNAVTRLHYSPRRKASKSVSNRKVVSMR